MDLMFSKDGGITANDYWAVKMTDFTSLATGRKLLEDESIVDFAKGVRRRLEVEEWYVKGMFISYTCLRSVYHSLTHSLTYSHLVTHAAAALQTYTTCSTV